MGGHRYIHTQDWNNAERVAQEHDESALAQVLLGHAKDEFHNKNYPVFESLLLRAQKPELIVKHYQVCVTIYLCFFYFDCNKP